MAGAKSLVLLLCFLLVLATSQAANCKFSVCYRACRRIGGSKNFCARKCHCSLLTFDPNELGRKVKMTAEALEAAEMEVDYNRAEAVVEEMAMEELNSLDDKLAAHPICKYQPCYRACRAVGGSKAFCARKCNCRLTTDAPAEVTDVKVVDDEASTATEMAMEELNSLDDKLAAKPICKYQPCYRACRAVGGSKAFCSRKCKCRLTTDAPSEVTDVKVVDDEASTATEMAMEELNSLDDKLEAKPICKYQPCYRACRAVGGSKAFCSRKCKCRLTSDAPAEGTDVKEVDDEAATATE